MLGSGIKLPQETAVIHAVDAEAFWRCMMEASHGKHPLGEKEGIDVQLCAPKITIGTTEFKGPVTLSFEDIRHRRIEALGTPIISP